MVGWRTSIPFVFCLCLEAVLLVQETIRICPDADTNASY